MTNCYLQPCMWVRGITINNNNIVSDKNIFHVINIYIQVYPGSLPKLGWFQLQLTTEVK